MHQSTTTSVHPLAEKWVVLSRDGGRPPHIGVLTRVRPAQAPERPDWWAWVLRTPTGHLVGSSPLANAVALTRADRALIARARRGLARRRAWLEGAIDPEAATVPPAVARSLADVARDRALLTEL